LPTWLGYAVCNPYFYSLSIVSEGSPYFAKLQNLGAFPADYPILMIFRHRTCRFQLCCGS